MQYVDVRDSKLRYVDENKDPSQKARALESDLATMVFESMGDKMRIHDLETLTAQLTFEIMNFKLGGDA